MMFGAGVNVLYDMSIWTLYISAGCVGIVWIATYLMIIFIESAVLCVLKWGTLRRSLQDAFLMNLASTLIGCAVPIVLLATDNIPGVALGLLAGWALSIGIEGGALTFINGRRKQEQHSLRQTWLASAAANTISYGMLSTLVLIGSILDF